MRTRLGLLLVVPMLVSCTERSPEAHGALPPGKPPSRAARLLREYDSSDPLIDLDALMPGGPPRDGIPALTDPGRVEAGEATYPAPGDRVVALEIDGEAVAYPLGIMTYHEIANDEVANVPVAVIYCPLCDSISVLDRRLTIEHDDGRAETLVTEFGVSGLLYNSNIVMYERHTMALWSQVYMKAVTGPHAGLALRHLPVNMMTFGEFQSRFPDGEVLSTATGHERPYERDPYASYLASDEPFRGLALGGDALPPKTLGLGVTSGDYVAFVTATAAQRGDPFLLQTPLGIVLIRADEGVGLTVESAPPGSRVVQTFYHSWSAFHPDTDVIAE